MQVLHERPAVKIATSWKPIMSYSLPAKNAHKIHSMHTHKRPTKIGHFEIDKSAAIMARLKLT